MIHRARESSPRSIDAPRPCDERLYRGTVDKLATALATKTYVDAIYQVGNVRHPGISDLDLLVVVGDRGGSNEDPLESLSRKERYLFTHSCFVVPASLAPELGKHVLLHGYRQLHGADQLLTLDSETATALEVQTALEFLAKNLLDLHVQLTYGVLKLRAFLQHTKGLRIDLEILGIRGGPIAALLDQAMSLMDDWFVRSDSERQAVQLAAALLGPLRYALSEAIGCHTLFAPSAGPVPVAPNMQLESGSVIEVLHRGMRLPPLPGFRDRRHFNAQHRTNRFRLRLPMTPARYGSYYASRFEFLSRAKSFATEHFPAYAAPIPPLFYHAL